MYQEENLTLMKIADKMDMEWWTVREVFEKHGIERISLSERAKVKRAKGFDLIYRTVYTLLRKSASRKYTRSNGFSPPYIRSVLKDQGVKRLTEASLIREKRKPETTLIKLLKIYECTGL